MKKFEVIEDNCGGLELFVFDDNNSVEYAHTGYEFCPGQLIDDLKALKEGADPKNEWEGDYETQPNTILSNQEFYDNLIEGIGYEIVCDKYGIYPERMGVNAWNEFKCNKKYNVECDFYYRDSINNMQEIYDNESEAIAAAKEYFNHLTESEKNKINDFCVTEIEIPEGTEIEDIYDFGAVLDDGKMIWTYEAEEIAEKIRKSETWSDDLNYELCLLAGIAGEYDKADGDTFESVVYKAADKLNVEI